MTSDNDTNIPLPQTLYLEVTNRCNLKCRTCLQFYGMKERPRDLSLEETKKIGGCPTGEVRSSKGSRLPAKWVIHTVGPVWGGGNRGEEDLLASCYRNSFKLARELGVKSIAFPSISTGAYRFPIERATEIALEETKIFLETDRDLDKVDFVCFGEKVLKIYQDVFKRVML